MNFFRSNPDAEIQDALRTWRVTGIEEDYNRYCSLCFRAGRTPVCKCGDENPRKMWKCEKCNKAACSGCVYYVVCSRCDAITCEYCLSNCDQCGMFIARYCNKCTALCKWCDGVYCEAGGFSKMTGEWTHRYIWHGGDNFDGCHDPAAHDCSDFPWA